MSSNGGWRFLHRPWKGDVEIFDGQLAGDQTREEQVTGLGEVASLEHQQVFLIKQWLNYAVEPPQNKGNRLIVVAFA